jgi:hypothetical protein
MVPVSIGDWFHFPVRELFTRKGRTMNHYKGMPVLDQISNPLGKFLAVVSMANDGSGNSDN